jgi:hypothetical protein
LLKAAWNKVYPGRVIKPQGDGRLRVTIARAGLRLGGDRDADHRGWRGPSRSFSSVM